MATSPFLALPLDLFVDRTLGGSMEDDHTAINDVVLKIPPSQISIYKSSLNHEFATLRTPYSQQIKSGYGNVVVSMNIVFVGNDQINYQLKPLIAGLRATPFCVCYSRYLEKSLRGIEAIDNMGDADYFMLRPLALAAESATISTSPGAPDSLTLSLQFLWFNYFPYMRTWIYKSGGLPPQHGTVFTSELWKEFYRPFMQGSDIDWPKNLEDEEIPAQIFFREYITSPAFNAKANQAVIDLLEIIKGKPVEAFNILGGFLKSKEIRWTDSNIWDAFWKAIGRNALLEGKDVSEEVRKRFKESEIQDGAITSAVSYSGAGKFLKVAAQYAYNNEVQPKSEFQWTQGDTGVIEDAIRALNERNNLIRQFEERQPSVAVDPNSNVSSYVSLPPLTVTHDYAKYPQGGKAEATVWGRKRKIDLSPQNGLVVEGITVNIRWNLAVIPMMAYRYPTVQFTGGVNINASLQLNCTNEGAAKLNTVYDMVESMAHKYRLVPHGYLNIWIKNDLLNFLDLKEFITQNISTQTISGQPGRSQIELQLANASVLSTTEIKPAESLTQEALTTTEDIYLSIAQRLHEFTLLDKGRRYYTSVRPKGKIRYSISPSFNIEDPKMQALGGLVSEYCKAYNAALDEAFRLLFNEDWNQGAFGYGGALTPRDLERVAKADSIEEQTGERPQWGNTIAGVRDERLKQSPSKDEVTIESKFQVYAKYFFFFMSRSERDQDFGLLPNISKMQEVCGEKANLNLGTSKPNCMSFKEDEANNYEAFPSQRVERMDAGGLHQSIEHESRLQSQFGLGNADVLKVLKDIQETQSVYIRMFQFLRKYQEALRQLTEKIQLYYLDLPEFQEIKKRVYAADIQKFSTSYRDFEEQIRRCKDLISTWDSSASQDLTKYNPDLYLFNDVTDGATANPERTGVLNPNVLGRARQLSLDSERNALGGANEWFKENYFSDLSKGPNKRPSDWLKKNFIDDLQARQKDPGADVPDPGNYYQHSIYSKQTFTNTLTDKQDKGKPFTKKLVVDGNKHAHLNQWTYKDALLAKNSVIHTTSFAKMWEKSELGTTSPQGISSMDAEALIPEPAPGSKMDQMVQFLKDYGAACQRVGLGRRWGGRFSRAGAPDKNKIWYDRWARFGIDGWDPMHVDMGEITEEDRQHTGPKSTDIDSLRPRFQEKVKQILSLLENGEVGSGLQWKPYIVSARRESSSTAKESKHLYGLAVDLGEATLGDSEGVYLRYLQENQISTQAPKPASDVVKENKVAPVSKDVTSTVAVPLELAYKEFQNDLVTGQALGLCRAYPTFKLFFIEDDQGERRMGFDDFFNYSAVQSIRIVRDRHIAADLCELFLTNISGVLTNRKFKQAMSPEKARTADGQIADETKDPSKVGTKYENPIASLMLQEGTHFSVYLGYSNDVKDLELVFTGVITEIEFAGSEEVIRILGQSYGIELVQDIKGFSKPEVEDNFGLAGIDFWGLGGDAFTGDMLEEMITQPEVLHFGRWTPLRKYVTPNRDLLTNKWHPKPTPQDDNIFAPSPRSELRDFADGIVFQSLKFAIYQTTIWDVFQEMTLRHPNYIAMPVPYRELGNDRMTMFFGLPNQLYFARDPKYDESNASAAMAREQQKTEKKLEETQGARLATNYAPMPVANIETVRDPKLVAEVQKLTNDRLEYGKERGYIRPFRKYHLITSAYHIVNNNIQANSRDVANTIVVRYNKDIPNSDEIMIGVNNSDIAIANADEEVTLKLDAAMPDEDVRTQVASFINVTNPNLARRYALGLLLRNTRNAYKGELVILGNARIKPNDVCYLFDEYNDMIGPIEVDRVVHIFTAENGFLTEIKPAMLTQAGEWTLLHSCTAMGIVMEGAVKDLFGKGPKGAITTIGQAGMSLMAPVGGALFDFFGGFMSDAVLHYTQFGFPLVMSPLNHRGRIFSGGIPTHKLPKSMWKCIFGDWSPMARDGFDMWLEDKVDEIMSTIKTVGMQNTVGKFWENSNTLEVK